MITIDLQGFQETRPGWTPTAARGAISPASEVMTARGRSTQWYVPNDQTQLKAAISITLCNLMLNLLQVKTAGKEAFQWGECSASAQGNSKRIL